MTHKIYREDHRWTVEFIPAEHVAGTVDGDYRWGGFETKAHAQKFATLCEQSPEADPWGIYNRVTL